jgi:hypothetical protein
MKRKFLTLTLALLGSVLLAATAQATECGGIEFALVAQNNAGMAEPSTINGNVLITSLTGTATIGAGTVINGALYAANIVVLGPGAAGRITECHGAVTGDVAACAAVFPFDPPRGVHKRVPAASAGRAGGRSLRRHPRGREQNVQRGQQQHRR